MFSTKRCNAASPCCLTLLVSVSGRKTRVARTTGGASPEPEPEAISRAAVELRIACAARRGEMGDRGGCGCGTEVEEPDE